MHKHWLIAGGLALGLMASGCSSSGSKTGTSPSVSPTTPSTEAATTTTGGPAVVSVATNAKYGQLLVGPNGHTLYLFAKDTGTTSACTGSCAKVWPGLTATGTPTAGAGVDASKLSTANGQVPDQVVYNGHLLYSFTPDAQPGDVNGAAIPNWFPVSPAGDKLTAP